MLELWMVLVSVSLLELGPIQYKCNSAKIEPMRIRRFARPFRVERDRDLDYSERYEGIVREKYS